MSKPDLAIFDLDNTILNGDSDYSMINYLVDINLLDEAAKLKNDEFIKDYQQGQLDFNQYTNFALKPYVGKTQDEINEIILPFVTFPRSAASIVEIAFKVVLLPAPFPPKSATILPLGTLRDTS